MNKCTVLLEHWHVESQQHTFVGALDLTRPGKPLPVLGTCLQHLYRLDFCRDEPGEQDGQRLLSTQTVA